MPLLLLDGTAFKLYIVTVVLLYPESATEQRLASSVCAFRNFKFHPVRVVMITDTDEIISTILFCVCFRSLLFMHSTKLTVSSFVWFVIIKRTCTSGMPNKLWYVFYISLDVSL